MHVLANNQLAYSVDICGREITVIFFSSCFILFILFHLLYLILLTTGRRDNTTPDFLAKWPPQSVFCGHPKSSQVSSEVTPSAFRGHIKRSANINHVETASATFINHPTPQLSNEFHPRNWESLPQLRHTNDVYTASFGLEHNYTKSSGLNHLFGLIIAASVS